MIEFNEVVEPCNNPDLPPILALRSAPGRAYAESAPISLFDETTSPDITTLGDSVTSVQLAERYNVTVKSVSRILLRHKVPIVGKQKTFRQYNLYATVPALAVCESKFVRHEGGKGYRHAVLPQ